MNIKCSRCNKDFIPSLKSSGESYKYCDKCIEYKKENKDKIKEQNKK